MDGSTTDYQVVEYVVGLCFVILSIGATLFFRILSKRYDLQEYMPIFDQYISEGIAWSRKKILDDYKKANIKIEDISENDIINNAITYILKNAPDTLKKLGVTEDNVRDKVEALIMMEYGDEGIMESIYVNK